MSLAELTNSQTNEEYLIFGEGFKNLVERREYKKAREYFGGLKEEEQNAIVRNPYYNSWLRTLRCSSF